MAGQVRDKQGGVKLAIWHTKSGKVLKVWDYSYQSWNLFVTFSPNRPLMALWQPGADEKQSGTLGFWDLSGLLK